MQHGHLDREHLVVLTLPPRPIGTCTKLGPEDHGVSPQASGELLHGDESRRFLLVSWVLWC